MRHLHPKHLYIFMFVLLAVLLLINLPGWAEGYFIIDDSSLFSLPFLRKPWNWAAFISLMTPGNSVDYLPVRDLTVWLDWSFNQSLAECAVFAKAQNFVWFSIIYFGLYRVLLLILENELTAFLLGSVWLFHPMHFESLQWITARKDLMAWTFFIWSAYFWMVDFRKQKSFSVRAVIFYVCSIYSKATFIFVAPVMFVYGAFVNYLWGRKMPLQAFIIGALISVLSLLVQVWNYTVSNNMRVVMPWESKLLASLAGIGRYVVGFFIPSANTVDVENWGPWLDYNKFYIPFGIFGLLLFIVFSFHSWRKKNVPFLSLLAIALGLMAATPGFNWMHRNFYSIRYFESFMFLILVGVALSLKDKIINYHRQLFILVLLLMMMTLLEAPHWTSNRAILEKAVNHSPQSASVRQKLLYHDYELLSMGRMDDEKKAAFLGEFNRLVDYCMGTPERRIEHVDSGCRGLFMGAYEIAKFLKYPTEKIDFLIQRGLELQHRSNESEFPWKTKLDDAYGVVLVDSRRGLFNKDAFIKYVDLFPSLAAEGLRTNYIIRTCFTRGTREAEQVSKKFYDQYLLDSVSVAEFLGQFKEFPYLRDCFYKNHASRP